MLKKQARRYGKYGVWTATLKLETCDGDVATGPTKLKFQLSDKWHLNGQADFLTMAESLAQTCSSLVSQAVASGRLPAPYGRPDEVFANSLKEGLFDEEIYDQVNLDRDVGDDGQEGDVERDEDDVYGYTEDDDEDAGYAGVDALAKVLNDQRNLDREKRNELLGDLNVILGAHQDIEDVLAGEAGTFWPGHDRLAAASKRIGELAAKHLPG